MTSTAPAAASAPRRNIIAVAAWMAGALVSFSAIAVSIRELSGALSVFELLALRSMRLPLIALVAFWLYAEPLDPYVFAGAIIIVVGILQSLRAESRRRQLPVENGVEK